MCLKTMMGDESASFERFLLVPGKLAESSDKSERGEPVCPNFQPKNVWPKVRHNFHMVVIVKSGQILG